MMLMKCSVTVGHGRQPDRGEVTVIVRLAFVISKVRKKHLKVISSLSKESRCFGANLVFSYIITNYFILKTYMRIALRFFDMRHIKV